MPGTRLLALVSRWFEPAIVAGVFEPLVADWQREWQAAPRAARVMVRARGTIAFILTALRLAPHLALAPLPAPLPGLLMVSVLAVCAAGLACLLGLLWLTWQDAPIPRSTWLLLLPALFTAFLPFAVAVGVDVIRGHHAWPEHVQRRAVGKLLAVVTLWMVIGGGWLAPGLGQQWRNALDSANAGQEIAPLTRVSGLSTHQLFSATHPRVHPLIRQGDRRREVENRVLLILLPILFACIRWRVVERRPGQWYVPSSVGMAVVSAVTIVILLRLSWSPYGPTSFLREHFLIWSWWSGMGLFVFRKLKTRRSTRAVEAP